MARTTPAAFSQHAQDLAKAFDVRLVLSDVLKPEEAFARPDCRIVFAAPIIDETTYLVVLHEIGHLAAPAGSIPPSAATVNGIVRRRTEEDAAWAWARHYALEWTPVMERIAQWAESTYHQPQPAPPAPEPKHQQIDWKDWRN